MSLTGTYHRTLDDKQRLAVPKRLRDELWREEKPVLYVAPETEQALTLYSNEEFQRRAEMLARSLPQQTTLRNYHRLYYSQAEQLEVDAQGRIRLPERLVSFAGLAQEVVLLGVHDHVEIWDRERWQQFLDRHASGFDSLAHAALGEAPTEENSVAPQEVTRIPR
jgi:MraZ protein